MIDCVLQNKIEEILAKYRGFTPLEIAEDLGIKIVYVSDGEDFSGAIKKADDGNIYIYVNKNDPENRQLFTISHELGHFFMHSEEVEGGIVSYRDASLYLKYSPEERKREEQANHFAAELLMPRKLFIDYYNDYSRLPFSQIIDKMKKFFGVSEKAIKTRMNYLDISKIR